MKQKPNVDPKNSAQDFPVESKEAFMPQKLYKEIKIENDKE